MNNLDRHITMALFSGYVGKLLLVGAGYPDIGIVAILGAAFFLFSYTSDKKQIDELKQQVKTSHSEMKNEVLRLQAMVDEHRTSLTSIKLAQGIRQAK